MRGLLFLGSLAVAAGACYLLCKTIDELTDPSDYNADSSDDISSGANLKFETYSAVVTKEWIITKTRDLFNNTSAKKIAVIDLKYVESFKDKFQKNFSQYVNEGYDYVLVLMDSCGDIIRVDVVKNLFGDDEEVGNMLGDEHMLVINA